jgi:hemerythrin superfamily protein
LCGEASRYGVVVINHRGGIVGDLLSQLEGEHRQVESWLEELEHAEEPGVRQRLLGQIEQALSQHMSIEELEVYPLLGELDDEMAEEARNEHDGARELLAKLKAAAPDTPGFGGIVAALTGAIGHHVEEEEGEAFPKLRKQMSDRIPPAHAAQRGPRARGSAGSPDADVASMSRDDLYEKAKELDISGRSSMSKGELAEAVDASRAK